MSLELFAHPFSSYSWKALIALYENDTPFNFRMLGPDHPDNYGQLVSLWPIAKFPLLLDGATEVFEASTIIEYLQLSHPGPVRLIPDDPAAAIEVRMLDRVFDNYVMTPMQQFVDDALHPKDAKESSVIKARKTLDTIYAFLNNRIAGRSWAAGDDFTLADVSAAPSLFYADWVHPIAEEHGNLRGYRTKLLAHPSIKRVVDEARPYRPLFPLGAPDRD
ncbi:MAG: glutathione S-transferase family protein [Sphingobium sp.]